MQTRRQLKQMARHGHRGHLNIAALIPLGTHRKLPDLAFHAPIFPRFPIGVRCIVPPPPPSHSTTPRPPLGRSMLCAEAISRSLTVPAVLSPQHLSMLSSCSAAACPLCSPSGLNKQAHNSLETRGWKGWWINRGVFRGVAHLFGPAEQAEVEEHPILGCHQGGESLRSSIDETTPLPFVVPPR